MALERDCSRPDSLRVPVRRSRPLVLVIDGHDDRFPLYAIALSGAGFDVAPVSDLEHAYTRARELSPNIVVTDWPVAKGSGSAFRDRLRQDSRTRDVRLVFLIDQVHRRERGRNQEQEGVEFLPKLCPPHTLVIVLQRMLVRPEAS